MKKLKILSKSTCNLSRFTCSVVEKLLTSCLKPMVLFSLVLSRREKRWWVKGLELKLKLQNKCRYFDCFMLLEAISRSWTSSVTEAALNCRHQSALYLPQKNQDWACICILHLLFCFLRLLKNKNTPFQNGKIPIPETPFQNVNFFHYSGKGFPECCCVLHLSMPFVTSFLHHSGQRPCLVVGGWMEGYCCLFEFFGGAGRTKGCGKQLPSVN